MLLTLFVTSALVSLATASDFLEQIQIRGKCLSAPDTTDGAPLVVGDCDKVAESSWIFQLDPPKAPPAARPIKFAGQSKCISVKNGEGVDGNKLEIQTCDDASQSQKFITKFGGGQIQWVNSDKCIDLTDGSTTDGNQIQIWTCTANNDNQNFSLGRNFNTIISPAKFTSPDGTTCLSASDSTNDSPVILGNCDNTNATWSTPISGFSSPGPVTIFGGSKCLQIPTGANAANGVKLSIGDCVAGAQNQLWFLQTLEPNSKTPLTFGGDLTTAFNAARANGGNIVGTPIELSRSGIDQPNSEWFLEGSLFLPN